MKEDLILKFLANQLSYKRNGNDYFFTLNGRQVMKLWVKKNQRILFVWNKMTDKSITYFGGAENDYKTVIKKWVETLLQTKVNIVEIVDHDLYFTDWEKGLNWDFQID
jgi:hypothetical protein